MVEYVIKFELVGTVLGFLGILDLMVEIKIALSKHLLRPLSYSFLLSDILQFNEKSTIKP